MRAVRLRQELLRGWLRGQACRGADQFCWRKPGKSLQKPPRPNHALTDVVAENLDQLGNLTALSVDVAHICEELKKRLQAVAAKVPPPSWSNPPLLGEEPGPDHQRQSKGRSPGRGSLSATVWSRKRVWEIGGGNRELVVRGGSAPLRCVPRSPAPFPRFLPESKARARRSVVPWRGSARAPCGMIFMTSTSSATSSTTGANGYIEHGAPHCAAPCAPVGST